jgi:hypothetical protein
MKMQQTNFRQVNEGFKWVFDAAKPEEQVQRLKTWASKNQTIVPMVRLGVGAEKADWRLPEGMPASAKIQEDIPEGMGETTLMLEWRRVKQFIDPNSNMNNLPDWKREQQWVNILEAIQHEEAKILTAVKDGELLKLYPKLEKCLPILGIEEYNKPPRKSNKKPAAKTTTKTPRARKGKSAPDEVVI